MLTSALYARFRSRQEHTFAEKVLSAWAERLSPAAFRRVTRDNAVRLLGL